MQYNQIYGSHLKMLWIFISDMEIKMLELNSNLSSLHNLPTFLTYYTYLNKPKAKSVTNPHYSPYHEVVHGPY